MLSGKFEIAKLCDFGVSQPLNRRGISVEGNYIGTPLWTAPEALPTGEGPISHKVDMFSFGLVIYEMITSHPPHTSSEELKLTDENQLVDEFEDTIFNSKLGKKSTFRIRQYVAVIYNYELCGH